MNISLTKPQFRLVHLVYFLLFLTSFSFGWMGFVIFGDIAGSCNVLVVSEESILELERKRVKREDGLWDAKDMFFGNQEEFLNSIFNIASSYADKNTKVIILSDKSRNVLGGVNITQEIHTLMVERSRRQKSADNTAKYDD